MHIGDLNIQIEFKCLKAEHIVPAKTVVSINISYVRNIQNVASHLYIPILFHVLSGGC